MTQEQEAVLPEQAENASSEHLAKAYDLLQELLLQHDGSVSSIQLKRELISRLGLAEPIARECFLELQFLDDEAAIRIGKPGIKTYHHGRRFFSATEYQATLDKTEEEAAEKEQEAGATAEVVEEPEKESARNRQEEARLGAYIKSVLEDIYASEHLPEGADYVFDVHRERPGSAYENVDLIAVHWRSEATVDLVTVEVKLNFCPKAIHQACNYARFSHRVWIASVVRSGIAEAALELRSAVPMLFDYAVTRGIGILGCRLSQGRSYQVFPIHWPRLQNPGMLDKELFIERYRSLFEENSVVEQRRKRAARF